MIRKPKPDQLSKRERQIMDVLYRLEQSTVGQVLAQLGNNPHYSTVRAQLGTLEQKGHVRHEEDGLRYIYFPVVPRDKAGRFALRHLIDTYFEGSAEKVFSALLAGEAHHLSPEEIGRLRQIVSGNGKSGNGKSVRRVASRIRKTATKRQERSRVKSEPEIRPRRNGTSTAGGKR
jgi:predicted transcriptional regulator